jgi:hypothetical protein
MSTGSQARFSPLGAAHLAIGVFLWLAAALIAFSWPWSSDPRFVVPLAGPAWTFHVAGILYLLISGANHCRLGGLLRRGERPADPAWTAHSVGHKLVLIATMGLLFRGEAGRAFLAQMAPLVGLLLATSGLSVLLAALVWRLLKRKSQVEVVLESMHPRRRKFDWLAAAQFVAGLLVVGSLAYLETRPLPNPTSPATAGHVEGGNDAGR